MINPQLDAFMAQFANEGLTFDDVSLVTQYADFAPQEATVASRFSRRIRLQIPFISAAMDTVTECNMAIAMALAGGIGVIHKNLGEDEQAAQVRQVKKYLNGLIDDPVVFRSTITLADLLAEKEERNYQFTGFPIIDENDRICGILTARDIKFVNRLDEPISSIMTPLDRLITAKPGTTLGQAFEIMTRDRIGKLPIVDDRGRLAGLYSYHDVKELCESEDSIVNRDDHYRLVTAAAVSPLDFSRVEKLVQADVDAVVVDTAHGYTKVVIDTLKELKSTYSDLDVVAGNIASTEGAKALLDAGADAIKVGVGPGSICTTRVVCGVGVPQLTAVYQTFQATQGEVPIIADGGIKFSGDVPKAVSVGADSVMMGSALAGTLESPGEKIQRQGRTYVVYRGMGSLEAMKAGQGSRARYGHKDTDSEDELIPQGIEGLVAYRGPVQAVLTQFAGGLRFALGYCGSRDLRELRRQAVFVRVSSAGLREAHPHDIRITKDAPNYTSEG